jgi:hypothetical protein
MCNLVYDILGVYKSPNSQPCKPDRPEESKYVEAPTRLFIQLTVLCWFSALDTEVE